VLVGQGYTNREVTEWLDISPATVKTHLSRAQEKLGVRRREIQAMFLRGELR
jgi:DNA-binding CsgD family transcriptional regulator